MVDLSSLSDSDLEALASGNMGAMSDFGLEFVASAPLISAQEPQGADWSNELLAVGNRGVEGISSMFDIAETANRNLNPMAFGGPRLFGLNENAINAQPLGLSKPSDLIKRGSEYIGLYGPERAQTETGKLLEAVAENTTAAAPFGPAAMAASGVFSGTGQYAGEAIGEMFGSPQAGRGVGAFLGGISPAGIRKIGIIKEIGEQLGPTVSQFPVLREIFGNAPVKAAVGRAISRSADDLPATEAALREAVETIGPPTELQSLKNTAEIAGDSGLARVEDAVQNLTPNAPFKDIAGQRAAVRSANVLKDYDPTATAYETSKGLEQTIGASKEALDNVADVAWKAFPGDTPILTDIPEVADDLARTLDDITYSGALPIEGEGAGLLKRFATATDEGVVSASVLQKLRSKALEAKRATAGRASTADRVTNDVAGALEEHVRNLIDTNVDKGLIEPEVAAKWITARNATRGAITPFAAPKRGLENQGTRGLEQLAIGGQSLDNTALLREGLNSPDKLVSHIQAAAAGGQDVRPLYQQALKAELDGAPQTQWRNIVDRRRNQWEMVFSADEMANLERNLLDVDQELVKNRQAFTSGSQTNPRGNVQNVLKSEKGLAGLMGRSSIPAVLGATQGASLGWNKSETTAGGIANALLYGTAGALIGKGLSSGAARASDSFDNLLTEAVRSPRAAIEAIEAAKPSNFTKQFSEAILDTAKVAAIKEGDRQVKKTFGDVFTSQATESVQAEGDAGPSPEPEKSEQPTNNTVMSDVFTGGSMEDKPPSSEVQQIDEGRFLERTSEVADAIGVDPNDLLKVMHFETGGTFDPAEKNRAGSGATGLIQFMPDTARELTGEQTREAAIKLLESMTATEQLDYVEKYLTPYKGRLNTLDDLYMAILYPRAIGQDSDYALFKRGTKAYDQNAGLDTNRDGKVTKSEAAKKVTAIKV